MPIPPAVASLEAGPLRALRPAQGIHLVAAPMTDDTDVQEFLGWARHRALPLDSAADRDHWQDLEGIGDLVGNVRVVGLGESHHYVREFNRFRSRLFKYLVDRKGFRVFVLECGLVEARRAYDYVLGEDLSPDDVFININNNFGLLKEVQELLAWMRKTNRSRRDGKKLLFYGMDGSAGWTRADTAIAAVCDYLDVVDPPLAEIYRGTLLPLAAGLTLYDLPRLPQDSVDRMACDLSSLVSHFGSRSLPTSHDRVRTSSNGWRCPLTWRAISGSRWPRSSGAPIDGCCIGTICAISPWLSSSSGSTTEREGRVGS